MRIALPARAGILHPAATIEKTNPERGRVLRDLISVQNSETLWPMPASRPRHRRSPPDELGFTRRLLNCEMATLFPDYKIPIGGEAVKYLSADFSG